MKKILRIPLLLVALFLSSIPISAHSFEVDGIYYYLLTNKAVAVTYQGNSYNSYTNEYTGSVTIPSSVTYGGTTYSVTSIGSYAFYECTGLTSVTIPNTVASIGYSAFDGCTGLTSITIPKSVTEIGDCAFYECSGLTSVTIPNSVTSIGSSAFYSCTGLTSVTIPNSVTEIGSSAFYGCTGLTEVNISDLSAWCKISFRGSDTNTSYYANPLYYAKKLKLNGSEITNLVIPNNITKIKDCAFYNCTGLTSITIPNSVTEIGSSAFEGCTGLTEVIISDLSAWCKINFGNNPLSYAKKLKLNGSEIKDLVIPNDITEIKDNAFLGCSGLTSVTIPNSVTSIGSCAFYNCSGLTSVTIPNSVTTIGNYAFSGCSGLTSVTIPNSVKNIYATAFSSCSSLSEIIVEDGNPVFFSYEGVIYKTKDSSILIAPAGMDEYVVPHFLSKVNLYNSTGFEVKSVVVPEGSAATRVTVGSYCDSLESLVINEPLDTIEFGGSYLGNAVNLKKLILPKKMRGKLKLYSTNYYTHTFIPIEILQVPNLSMISFVEDRYRSYSIENGEYYVYEFYKDNNYYSFYLPATLKQLIITDQSDFYDKEYDSWYDFPAIRDDFEIEILKPVTNFQSTTFYYSSISTIAIDSDEIPAELFKGCDNLKSLTLPFPGVGTAQTTSNFGELFGTKSDSNMRAVTQFFEDGTKKTYYLPTGLEELVLTEGCEMIPYGGLYNCNMLKRLTLPTSLYMVGDKALYGCAQISDIYCKGADPAVAYDSSFDGMRLTSCKLHVPYNSSERYKISDGWKRFYYVEEEAPLVVSVAKNIENAGVVYGINEYQPGQVAEVEAVAHSGYTFVGWYENGNLLTTDSKYTIMVTDSHSLVAMFAPVLDENEVEVAPQDKNVTLSWAQETGATYYNIDIYSDATMTMQVGRMVVDNTGQPVSRSTATVSATIDGLNEMQNYYYSISAIGEGDVVLSKYIGTFSTSAGINNIYYNDNATEVARYDIYGHRLSEPTKGINIVKYSDGTTRKEFVK